MKPPGTTSRSPRSEASHVDDSQYVTDLYTFRTEVALWADEPDVALKIALRGLRQARGHGQRDRARAAGPPRHPGRGGSRRASPGARDPEGAERAVEGARDVIGRYAASIARLVERDTLAEREIGWRMAICEAELARAAGDDDPSRWMAIRDAVAARPAPFREAYVLWRAAEAAASGATGTRAAAAAAGHLREAHEIAARIGARPLQMRIERLGRQLRIDLAPAEAPTVPLAGIDEPGQGRASPALTPDPFGLTRREREVLELVTLGYTNRRIAETLFITESTAGVHVSNILGKLGVATRTEAATVAVRLGLDRSAPA